MTGGQRGSATVELALGIPVLVGAATLMLGLVMVGARQVQITDAARGLARDLARGDHSHAGVWGRSLPANARVSVTTNQHEITVRITDDIRWDAPLVQGFRIPLSARSVAADERAQG